MSRRAAHSMVLIEATNLPRHVGIIMDGNGRWAERRGMPRPEGHRAGSRAVRRIVRMSRRVGLEALTLYAFSFQNWARPDYEVGALMALLEDYLHKERAELLERKIRLEAVGELARLPAPVATLLEQVRADTAQPDAEMTLSLALSYGGQEEIAAAARLLAERAARGEMDPTTIDVDVVAANLPSLRVGAPDLIIRTGGEMRLSNFLLYGSAYAELFFSDRLWPDFTEEDLFEAIASYQHRERRYGKVPKSANTAAAPTADTGA